MPTGGCDAVPEVARPAPDAPSPPMLADAALLGELAPPPLPLARQKELYEINKLLHMELISCYIIQKTRNAELEDKSSEFEHESIMTYHNLNISKKSLND